MGGGRDTGKTISYAEGWHVRHPEGQEAVHGISSGGRGLEMPEAGACTRPPEFHPFPSSTY